MIKVKRWMFICWAKGIILERDYDAKVIAIEDGKCEEAENAMNKGEIIGLLDNNGKIISTMSLVDGEYKEEVYSEEGTC